MLDEEHHDYSGSTAMIAALKKRLTPEALKQFERPEVGEPVQVIG